MKLTYSNVVATVALFLSVAGAGAIAADVVTSRDIKNGTIDSKDIGKQEVASSDIDNGGVVGKDLKLPAPASNAVGQELSVKPSNEFALLAAIATVNKLDPSSVLRVSWTGAATSDFSDCVFQLRVDGQMDANGAGEVYVGDPTSISVESLFPGLGAGPHEVQVWARLVTQGVEPGTYPCTINPAVMGIDSTVVVEEVVS